MDEANYFVDPNTGLMYNPSPSQDNVVYTANANSYKINDTTNKPLDEGCLNYQLFIFFQYH